MGRGLMIEGKRELIQVAMLNMRYTSLYKESLMEKDLSPEQEIEREKESKYVRKLIKQLRLDSHSNKEMRAEFAKIIFQIALSSDPYARKFIKKLSDFCGYWENDNMIDEDEWHKLNNSGV
jgi:hypothetical protein